MIMQWKTKGQEHEAAWQGQQFKLAQVFSVKEGWRWHLWVDGVHVKQNWQTPKQAMESIDAEQCKVIMAAAALLQQRVVIPKSEVTAALVSGARVDRQTQYFEDGSCRERFVKTGGPSAQSA